MFTFVRMPNNFIFINSTIELLEDKPLQNRALVLIMSVNDMKREKYEQYVCMLVVSK